MENNTNNNNQDNGQEIDFANIPDDDEENIENIDATPEANAESRNTEIDNIIKNTLENTPENSRNSELMKDYGEVCKKHNISPEGVKAILELSQNHQNKAQEKLDNFVEERKATVNKELKAIMGTNPENQKKFYNEVNKGFRVLGGKNNVMNELDNAGIVENEKILSAAIINMIATVGRLSNEATTVSQNNTQRDNLSDTMRAYLDRSAEIDSYNTHLFTK